jgi:mono/diheme cytochrome c family protein/glucose/arabinose dehydrogenase
MGKTFYLFLFIVSNFCSCSSDSTQGFHKSDSLTIRKEFAQSPFVSPEASVGKMKIEEGFSIQLVASEPLISAPIAMTFDEQGRMWVVEMQGYMPDTTGVGEDQLTGKIVILQDKNKDGVADERIVFLDSLGLPRAICLVENGVLIAEPPYLWFVERDGDRPGKKTLVDDKYTEGGNAEHQANGLLRSLDNWIYNANSRKRYKKKGNSWLIKNTHFRGQWGITQDDFGRLFYNHNSANVLGDYFLPSLGASNKNQLKLAGFNEKIVADNRVYPSRANMGVNRGYMKGVLDSNLRLVNFTAACGPLIYRGGELFGDKFRNNAFVAEPAANLIKRNILRQDGYVITGEQAYTGKEFLSSIDERFRPVSLYNGPDGALYIVDMYRGIIEHKTYLTEYLKNEIKERGLSSPLSCGRIYKVVPSHKKAVSINIPKDPLKIVSLLTRDNGWLRDKAQQLIIDNGYVQTIPELRRLLKTGPLVTRVHALWTLEGLGVLTVDDVLPLLRKPDRAMRMQALTAMQSVMTKNTYKRCLDAIQLLFHENDSIQAPSIAFQVETIDKFDKVVARQLLFSLIRQNPQNKYVADALISSLYGKESLFLKENTFINADTTLAINKQLRKVVEDMHNSRSSKDAKLIARKLPLGASLFKTICQTCHGYDGNGVQSLAPPLNRSEWVTGDKTILSSIVLYGLTGPVEVNGKLYKQPEINGEMPGIGNNETLSDEQIAQLLSFIRQSWRNKADEVSKEIITRMRSRYAGREKAFTIEELKERK